MNEITKVIIKPNIEYIIFINGLQDFFKKLAINSAIKKKDDNSVNIIAITLSLLLLQVISGIKNKNEIIPIHSA